MKKTRRRPVPLKVLAFVVQQRRSIPKDRSQIVNVKGSKASGTESKPRATGPSRLMWNPYTPRFFRAFFAGRGRPVSKITIPYSSFIHFARRR